MTLATTGQGHSAESSLGFGRVFTDHMTSMSWTPGGWGRPQLLPFQNLSLSPASSVFHGGQTIFEGLKAYRHPDGQVRLFRPELNARRLSSSAHRLSMPTLAERDFLECVALVVAADAHAVPMRSGYSLYLRPIMIATEATLMTRPATQYLFLVIASPSGPYFSHTADAITVWVSEEYPRAHRGGIGATQSAGNHAAGMLSHQIAAEHGGDQAVYVDARERRYLEGLGGMNLFLVREQAGKTSLVTPPLSDTILNGITRQSILTLAGDMGVHVEERPVSLQEWRTGDGYGRVTEAFACGTAAAVTPIGKVRERDGEFLVGEGKPGPLSVRLRSALLGIQEGTRFDQHGWMRALR